MNTLRPLGLLSRLRTFRRSEDGAATIELVLILPVFLLIVALVVDSSMILFRQAQAYRIVQDANRALSLGRISTADETSALIVAALQPIAPSATATAQIANGIVTTTLTMPLSDIQMTGLLAAFDGGSIGVTASHILER